MTRASLKHRSRLRAVSPRRRRRDAEWARVTTAVIRASNGFCGIGVRAVCTRVATEGHHRKLRSQGGTNTIDNCVPTCAACHRYAHANPEWAYSAGFMVRRSEAA